MVALFYLLLPAVISFVLLGVVYKLTARFLNYQGVTWVRICLFMLVSMIVTLTVNALLKPTGSDPQASIAVTNAITLGIHLLLGIGYFSLYMQNPSGEKVGWPGSVRLVAIASLFGVLINFGIAYLIGSMLRASMVVY